MFLSKGTCQLFWTSNLLRHPELSISQQHFPSKDIWFFSKSPSQQKLPEEQIFRGADLLGAPEDIRKRSNPNLIDVFSFCVFWFDFFKRCFEVFRILVYAWPSVTGNTQILGANHFTSERRRLCDRVIWCKHDFFYYIVYVLESYIFFLPPALCMIFVDGVEKTGFPLWISLKNT